MNLFDLICNSWGHSLFHVIISSQKTLPANISENSSIVKICVDHLAHVRDDVRGVVEEDFKYMESLPILYVLYSRSTLGGIWVPSGLPSVLCLLRLPRTI